jgi:hypothetical protein
MSQALNLFVSVRSLDLLWRTGRPLLGPQPAPVFIAFRLAGFFTLLLLDGQLVAGAAARLALVLNYAWAQDQNQELLAARQAYCTAAVAALTAVIGGLVSTYDPEAYELEQVPRGQIMSFVVLIVIIVLIFVSHWVCVFYLHRQEQQSAAIRVGEGGGSRGRRGGNNSSCCGGNNSSCCGNISSCCGPRTKTLFLGVCLGLGLYALGFVLVAVKVAPLYPALTHPLRAVLLLGLLCVCLYFGASDENLRNFVRRKRWYQAAVADGWESCRRYRDRQVNPRRVARALSVEQAAAAAASGDVMELKVRNTTSIMTMMATAENAATSITACQGRRDGLAGSSGREGVPDVSSRQERLDVPSRHGMPDVPSRQGMLDVPSRQGILDLPSRQGMLDGPSRQGILDVPSRQGMADGPSRQGMPDGQSRQGMLDDTSRQEMLDGSSRQGMLDVPSRQGMSNVPSRQGMLDVPSRQGMLDGPSRHGMLYGPSRQGMLDVSSRQGMLEGPSRHERLDVLSRQGMLDVPSRQGMPDVPSRQGMPDVPSRQGTLLDGPSRQGMLDGPSRQGMPDGPSRQGGLDGPSRQERLDVPSRQGMLDVPSRQGMPDVPRRQGMPDVPSRQGIPDERSRQGGHRSGGQGRPDRYVGVGQGRQGSHEQGRHGRSGGRRLGRQVGQGWEDIERVYQYRIEDPLWDQRSSDSKSVGQLVIKDLPMKPYLF